MNILDSTIAFFAPETGQKRLRARMAIEMMEGHKRKFEGAAKGRRFGNFGNPVLSTNQELATDLPYLRSRSRYLYNNNPYAKNGINRIAKNVVGVGIVPTPLSDNEKLADKIKTYWKEWAEGVSCDFDGKSNFYGLQKMAMKSTAKVGEGLARRVWVKEGKNTLLKIQLLEPEYLDNNKGYVDIEDGGYIMNGVQFSKNNQVSGYWIYDRHPLEYNTATSKLIDAKDIIHMFDPEDPGQVRGIPFLSPVILRMKDFDEFEDAKLMQQKISALFGVIISGGDDEITVGKDKNEDGADLARLQPGEIRKLETGKTITVVSPPSVDGFEAYSRQSLQGQAAGLGISAESLTGDLSNVNFSSGRMGWIEMNRNIEDWQWNLMVPQFCEKAWGWFIDYLVLKYGADFKGAKAEWTAPRRQMIDPVKETNALVKQIRAGLKSQSEAIRENGDNPEEIFKQQDKDKQQNDKYGLMPESDPRFDPVRISAQAKVKKQEQDAADKKNSGKTSNI